MPGPASFVIVGANACHVPVINCHYVKCSLNKANLWKPSMTRGNGGVIDNALFNPSPVIRHLLKRRAISFSRELCHSHLHSKCIVAAELDV